MAVARDLAGKNNNVICVIGDGAMSAGMAYEAMNNAGSMKSRLIVHPHDNEMSIDQADRSVEPLPHPPRFIQTLFAGPRNRQAHRRYVPPPLRHAVKRAEESARMAMGAGTLFEEMGFYYIGPVDGHNLDHLLPVLRNVRDSEYDGPILIHALTKKAKATPPPKPPTTKCMASSNSTW